MSRFHITPAHLGKGFRLPVGDVYTFCGLEVVPTYTITPGKEVAEKFVRFANEDEYAEHNVVTEDMVNCEACILLYFQHQAENE